RLAMCSRMADLSHRITRLFRGSSFGDVEAATRSVWPAEHKSLSSWLTLSAFLLTLLFCSSGFSQESGGPALLVTTEAGASSELPLVRELITVQIDQGH